MTEHGPRSLPDQVLRTILSGSLDGLPGALSLLINQGYAHRAPPALGRRSLRACPRPQRPRQWFQKALARHQTRHAQTARDPCPRQRPALLSQRPPTRLKQRAGSDRGHLSQPIKLPAPSLGPHHGSLQSLPQPKSSQTASNPLNHSHLQNQLLQ